jgi:hypothetical protein
VVASRWKEASVKGRNGAGNTKYKWDGPQFEWEARRMRARMGSGVLCTNMWQHILFNSSCHSLMCILNGLKYYENSMTVLLVIAFRYHLYTSIVGLLMVLHVSGPQF